MSDTPAARLAAQARQGLRAAVLDAAYTAVVGAGWAETPMAALAAQVGVSRQTLYNEFGSKDGVARALVEQHNTTFLDGVEAALHTHRAPAQGIAEAVEFALRTCAEDPLTKAVLTSARNDLLPFLTTRSEPLLVAARERLAGYLLDHWPHLPVDRVERVADAVVRLVVSHVVLPIEPPEITAGDLAEIAERYLSA